MTEPFYPETQPDSAARAREETWRNVAAVAATVQIVAAVAIIIVVTYRLINGADQDPLLGALILGTALVNVAAVVVRRLAERRVEVSVRARIMGGQG